MKTLQDCDFNGEIALKETLLSSPYKMLKQAIASLTLFTHPEIVKHTKNRALFRIRKFHGNETKGGVVNEKRVVLDDNQSPTNAFLWTNDLCGRRKPKEVQFNHIYPTSFDPLHFTSLANICVTPAFLAKLTDTNDEIKNLIRYRAWRLYQKYLPEGFEKPTKPEGYDELHWAPYPCQPFTREDLKAKIEAKFQRCPQSRAAVSARHFGWLFGPLTQNS